MPPPSRIAYILLWLLSLLLSANTIAAQSSQRTPFSPDAITKFAERVCTALQARDAEALFDLSYETQLKVVEIKQENPEVLWSKMIADAKADAKQQLLQRDDLFGYFVSPHTRSMLEVKAGSWSRNFSDQPGMDQFAKLIYDNPRQSPIVDGKFVKEIILRISFDAESGCYAGGSRIPQGDVFWEESPPVITGVGWDGVTGNSRGTNGYLQFRIVGGTLPFSVESVIGSQRQQITISEAKAVYSMSKDFLTVARFPSECSIAITDKAGNRDSVGFSVRVPSDWYWIRRPWFDSGVGVGDSQWHAATAGLGVVTSTFSSPLEDAAQTSTGPEVADDVAATLPDSPDSNTGSVTGGKPPASDASLTPYERLQGLTPGVEKFEDHRFALNSAPGEVFAALKRVLLKQKEKIVTEDSKSHTLTAVGEHGALKKYDSYFVWVEAIGDKQSRLHLKLTRYGKGIESGTMFPETPKFVRKRVDEVIKKLKSELAGK